MADKMRVVIINEHPLFRQGVAQALSGVPDIEVLAEGASAEDAVRLASDLLPDILVLDLGIRDAGLAAVQAVAARSPGTRMVMLTASVEQERLVAALRVGVRAYVLKEVSGQDLVEILRGVWAGQAYITPALGTALLLEMTVAGPDQASSDRPSSGSLMNELSERERQILELVADGLSNREIALRVGLREKTVKDYMSRILHTLHVRNRVAAALLLGAGNRQSHTGLTGGSRRSDLAPGGGDGS